MVDAPKVLRPVAGPAESMRFVRCPIAEVREPGGWVQRVLEAASQHQAGVPLRDIVREPTAVLTEGLAVLDAERRQVEHFERERAAEQARRGA